MRAAAVLLTVFATATGVSAGLAQARQALAHLYARQDDGDDEVEPDTVKPNDTQYWANDFADLDWEPGANGSFQVTWDNPPGGNFVVGKGYRPARDM
jgi:hypothetical protein